MIHAAGGLVWRRGARGRELAVIRRWRHGKEWTFPKGKLRRGEGWEAAAVREVGEETGCLVECGPFAGGQIYLVTGRPKVVLYWHMRLVRAGAITDTGEVQTLRWLTPGAARTRLSYPSEQRLLAEALASAPALAPHLTEPRRRRGTNRRAPGTAGRRGPCPTGRAT